MTTIINTPGGGTSTDSGSDSAMGVVLGVILAIVLIALFVIYGLPYLRRGGAAPAGGSNNTINVQVPNPIPTAPSGNQNQAPAAQ